jgi:hypothetical protein
MTHNSLLLHKEKKNPCVGPKMQNLRKQSTDFI